MPFLSLPKEYRFSSGRMNIAPLFHNKVISQVSSEFHSFPGLYAVSLRAFFLFSFFEPNAKKLHPITPVGL